MADCLHVYRGYRVPPEVVEQAKQAIIDTPRIVDVDALRSLVQPSLVAVNPWHSITREVAAKVAVQSILFDATRAGLIRRSREGWAYTQWKRVRKVAG